MSEPERIHITLLAIIESIEKVEKITANIHSVDEFENDFKSFDACLMNFIVMGEMTLRLHETFLNKHNEIEWFKIRAFRNMVAHDYFGIDVEKVWDIIQNKLPELKQQISKVLTNNS